MFILNEILSSRKEAGVPSFLVFIDVAKAYDRVWRPGLWHKLEVAGADTQTLDIIKLMFRSVIRRVLLGDHASDEFPVDAGVPQGAVLSPFLYALYINGLHAALRDRGLGILVFGRLIPLLFYADDIVLLAGSSSQLAAMLQVMEEYACKWRFEVNHEKTNVMVVGSLAQCSAARAHVWYLCGAVIAHTDAYK